MRRPWLVKEIEKLNKAVQEYGRNWVKVSSIVGNGRSNDDCRRKTEFETNAGHMTELDGKRRMKYSRLWKPEEVIQLTDVVLKYGREWRRIVINLRTNKECMRKVRMIFKSGRMQAEAALAAAAALAAEDVAASTATAAAATAAADDFVRKSLDHDNDKKCKIKKCSERCIIGSRYCTEHRVTSVRYNLEMAVDYGDPYKRYIRKCNKPNCFKKVRSEGLCAGHHPIKRVYKCRECLVTSTSATPRNGICYGCLSKRRCSYPGCDFKASVRNIRKTDLLYCVEHKDVNNISSKNQV